MKPRIMTEEQVEKHNARVRAHRKPVEPIVTAVPINPTRRKHGNVPTVIDGIRFDSKHEAQVWVDLKLREKAGEIRNLQRQVSFPLEVAGTRIQRWRADFVFWEQGGHVGWTWIVADAKSPHTAALPAWKRTKALFESLYGMEVTIL